MTLTACIWYESSTNSGKKNGPSHNPSSSAVQGFLLKANSITRVSTVLGVR